MSAIVMLFMLGMSMIADRPVAPCELGPAARVQFEAATVELCLGERNEPALSTIPERTHLGPMTSFSRGGTQYHAMFAPEAVIRAGAPEHVVLLGVQAWQTVTSERAAEEAVTAQMRASPAGKWQTCTDHVADVPLRSCRQQRSMAAGGRVILERAGYLVHSDGTSKPETIMVVRQKAFEGAPM